MITIHKTGYIAYIYLQYVLLYYTEPLLYSSIMQKKISHCYTSQFHDYSHEIKGTVYQYCLQWDAMQSITHDFTTYEIIINITYFYNNYTIKIVEGLYKVRHKKQGYPNNHRLAKAFDMRQ